MSMSTQEYFKKLADYLRRDLTSGDRTRVRGAATRIRRAIPSWRFVPTNQMRERFRLGDALNVIAIEQGMADWRALSADPEGVVERPELAGAVTIIAPVTDTLGPVEHDYSDDAYEDADFVYLTNGSCESTGDFKKLRALNLPTGEWGGEFYPLTDSEARFIGEDCISTAGQGVALLGYSVLYQNEKWIAPHIQYRYGDDPEPVRVVATRQAAEAERIGAAVEELGGEVIISWDKPDDRECTLILLPPEALAKRFRDYAAYRAWLENLLNPPAKA